jgi:hypothetical protein
VSRIGSKHIVPEGGCASANTAIQYAAHPYFTRQCGSPAIQFVISIGGGGGVLVGVLTRNRWPSPETSYTLPIGTRAGRQSNKP